MEDSLAQNVHMTSSALAQAIPGRCRCRYDDGCTGVTNIDFSKGVIKDMMLKNLRQRPRMKWLVMDMTQTKASTSTFTTFDTLLS